MSFSSFGPALRSDLFLFLRGRGLRLLIFLPALCAVARIALGRLQSAQETARGMVSGRQAEVSDGSAYGPFVDGVHSGLVVLYLVVLAFAAFSLAFDREHGILRQVLIRRVDRSALLGARFLLVNGIAVAMCGLLLLAAWAAAALFYDFLPIVEDGYELIGTAEMHREIIRGVMLATVPLPAAIGFGVLVAVVARTAAEAVAATLGVVLVFDLFKGLLGEAARYVYASYHPSLLDRSYLQEVGRIVRGYSDVFVEDATLYWNWVAPVSQAALFVVLAAIVFRRRGV